MNTGQLKIPTYKGKLTKLLTNEQAKMETIGLSIQDTLLHCVLQSMRYSRAWGKWNAFLKHKKGFPLRKELSEAQLNLQAAPQDLYLQAAVEKCCQILSKLDAERAKWVRNTIQSTWLIKGNRSTNPSINSRQSLGRPTFLRSKMPLLRWSLTGRKLQLPAWHTMLHFLL